MNDLYRTKKIFNIQHFSIIQDGFPGKSAKYLMLICHNNLHVGFGAPVKYRNKIPFQSLVGGKNLPT